MHLLDVRQHNAKATFFLIGKDVAASGNARAILAAGHEMVNHTDSHPNLFWFQPAAGQELDGCASLGKTAGTKITLFRPPFGGRRQCSSDSRNMGLVLSLCPVTAYDWSAKSAEAIVGK